MDYTMEVLSRIAFSDTLLAFWTIMGDITTVKTDEYHYHRKPTAEEKACWISSTGKTPTADATKLVRTCQQYAQWCELQDL